MSTINKKSKIKKPVEIKEEKAELRPLGTYANDRVELIRQAFSCLKSKYIKSICPEVLAGRSVQEIQECCLDELLGISKKRLLAILNATECPSDTDSSSENGSDRDDGREYISLEEISSDEEMNEKQVAENKEISVLELLELQARARAIRSQLALEPITKIELDSDKEGESSSSSSTSTLKKKEKPNLGKAKKIDKRTSDIEKMFADLDNDENEVTSTQRLIPQTQPIRLKRNFLKRENRPTTTVSNACKNDSAAICETVQTNIAKPAEKVEGSKVQIEKFDDAGCSSPDIITVVQSPETYSITDSEEEVENESLDNKVSTTIDEITTDEIPKESSVKRAEIPEEGEIVEEKAFGAETILISANTIGNDHDSETDGCKLTNLPTGETSKTIPGNNEKPEDLTKHQNDSEQNIAEQTLTVDLADEELDYELKDDSEVDSDNDDKSKKNENENVESETIEIIESSEEEAIEASAASLVAPEVTVDEDKIDKECLSFHERWLGSKKVSKILATSRLGNRVRENIKSKNAARRAQNLDSPTSEQATEKQLEPEAEPVDYDVDSVEHYKNLVSNADKNELTENNLIDTNGAIEESDAGSSQATECKESLDVEVAHTEDIMESEKL